VRLYKLDQKGKPVNANNSTKM